MLEAWVSVCGGAEMVRLFRGRRQILSFEGVKVIIMGTVVSFCERVVIKRTNLSWLSLWLPSHYVVTSSYTFYSYDAIYHDITQLRKPSPEIATTGLFDFGLLRLKQ